MSNLLFAYVVQFAPVLFGIAFVALMKSIRLKEEKIVLRHSAGLGQKKEIQTELHDKNPRSEDARGQDFEKYAYDTLIENGLMAGGARDKNIRELAWERLGLADIKEIQSLAGAMKPGRHGKLILFAPEHKTLLRLLLSFKNPSGILLSYLAGYRLEVTGA